MLCDDLKKKKRMKLTYSTGIHGSEIGDPPYFILTLNLT